jgi:CheY-like chemotaxis protein
MLKQAPSMPKIVLLLVEDNYLIMLSTKEALEAVGYVVHDAADCAAATCILDDPDLHIAGVITDVGLGSGPTGWDVATYARETLPNIPVVYATGGHSADWPTCGVTSSILVEKPYAPAQVITAISRLLDSD